MKYYTSYMDRQEISPAVHEKLLNLEAPKRRSRPVWVRYGALAACAALVIGVGVWRLTPDQAPAEDLQSAAQFAPDYEPKPGEKDVVGPEDPAPDPDPYAAIKDELEQDPPDRGTEDAASRGYPGDSFVVNSPAAEGETAFYYMPAIHFQDVANGPSTSLDWDWAKGSFRVFLNMEDIQKIFWGPETDGTEVGDLPWALFWDGYTLRAHAWYSPEGKLLEVCLFGEKGSSSFELRVDPGQLPITCLLYPDLETSEVFGTEVTGWSRVYDDDGDGQDDYICVSEFMTENDIGIRFESRNNGRPEDGLDGEAWFNTLFVRQALVGGLHLDHLLTADDIPDDPDATW